MLPNGLKLFIADIVDEDNYEEHLWCVLGRTYDSAFKRFSKEANETWATYLYYFNEADEDDIKTFIFLNKDEDIVAGVYEEDKNYFNYISKYKEYYDDEE